MENNNLNTKEKNFIKDINNILSSHIDFENKIVGYFPKANNAELCKVLEFVKSLAKEFKEDLQIIILKRKENYDLTDTPLILGYKDVELYNGFEIPKEFNYLLSEEYQEDIKISIRKQIFILEMLDLIYTKNIDIIDNIIKKYSK